MLLRVKSVLRLVSKRLYEGVECWLESSSRLCESEYEGEIWEEESGSERH